MREIGEDIQMLIRDNNFRFWFCSVFVCLGLAEASGVIALQQLSGVFKVKHGTVFTKIKQPALDFGFNN